MNGLKIALVGGAGFIGHNLALHLKSLGANVEIIDSLQVNNLYAFERASSEVVNRELYIKIINERLDLLRQANIPLHLQDARDYHALSALLSDIQPQVVVQLAAVSHANRSNKDPYSTFDHSLRTLENALDAVRDRQDMHFIFFSSSMVYGDFLEEAMTEDMPCNPLGIYGALKFAGEKLVIAYSQVFGLNYTIIRPSALYGERCVSRRVGQIFLENALQGKNLTINGEGLEKLDFTYIQDLTTGIVNAIQHKAARNEIFNITCGEGRSIVDMAQLVQKYFPNVQIIHEAREAFMPIRGTLSIEKAKRLMAYQPVFSLEEGYTRYIAWYQQFCGLKHVLPA
jgi:nucleoside-diphosphate-sugar epimerase